MQYRVYRPSQAERIITEFGNWLSPYRWDWYGNHTFRNNILPVTAGKLFERFILKAVNKDVIYFYAIEWHKVRYATHIHSLVGNVQGINRWVVMKQWDKRYGFNRIFPYQKERGARFYLAKFIPNGSVEWDIKLK